MKYLVKLRKVHIQEYEIEVNSNSVVNAMDLAEKLMPVREHTELFNDESVVHTFIDWTPIAVKDGE